MIAETAASGAKPLRGKLASVPDRMDPGADMTALPYQIATLVYIFNRENRLLLLHRSKSPNRDLYSPIGGKLEQAGGESPYTCALREIREETGVELELRAAAMRNRLGAGV